MEKDIYNTAFHIEYNHLKQACHIAVASLVLNPYVLGHSEHFTAFRSYFYLKFVLIA